MTDRNRAKSNILYKSIEFDNEEGRGWWEDENGNFFVRSYYTDDNPDSIGDVIMRDATERAVGSWRKWGNIRMQHDPSRPIGKVKEIGENDGLDWNRFVAHIVDEEAKKLIKAGVLGATSVGIIVLDYEEIDLAEVDFERSPLARVSWFPPIRITEYEMVEISMVDNPMNQAAVVGGKSKFAMNGVPEDQIKEIVESRAKALSAVKGAAPFEDSTDGESKSLGEGADGASSYRTEEEEKSPEVDGVSTVAPISEENVMEEKEMEPTEENVAEPEVEKDIEEEATEVEDTDVEETEEVEDVPDVDDEYTELDVAVDRILGFMEEFKTEMLAGVESLKGMLMNKAEEVTEDDDTEEATEEKTAEINAEEYIRELVQRIVGEELDKVQVRKSAVVLDEDHITDNDEPEQREESLVRYIGANREEIQAELRQAISKMKR